MSSVINNYIQRRLQQENRNEVSVTVAAQWLDEEGILKDLSTSRGYPLRRYIKRGKIFGVFRRKGRFWFIRKLENYEDIIGARELARVLGLKSRNSIYQKIKLSEIPVERVGKKGIFIYPSQLLRWALENGDLKLFRKLKNKYGILNSED